MIFLPAAGKCCVLFTQRKAKKKLGIAICHSHVLIIVFNAAVKTVPLCLYIVRFAPAKGGGLHQG